jgi:hypothetical protein
VGSKLPCDLLFDEYTTLFGRVVLVIGTDPVSGITAQGRTREEVVAKIARMLDHYLTVPTEQDVP